MSDFVFDLTEVFSASTGKLRFYGIMRVVQEIGIELVRQQLPVRFGIFSYGHQGFLEVKPVLHDDGNVSLDVPLGLHEIRMRPVYSRRSLASKAATRVINPLLQRYNMRVWNRAGVTRPRLDLDGKILVTAARPKLITAALDALERRGERVDLVPLLHDMIPLHPEFGHKSAHFPGKFLDDNRRIISASRAIIANSDFTKQEIEKFSDAGLLPKPPRMFTVPLVHECAPDDGQPTLQIPDDPYFLTVGATLGRKNLDVSFDALLHLQAEGKRVPRLIIAGAKRGTTERFLATEKMQPVRDRITMVPTPSQSDLNALYRNARGVIMASRLEGWGLPAGEGLWWGTPAICSTAPVLREVCGDLGLYFDPDDPEELAAHITRLLEDTAFEQALRKSIADARPELRTWARVASDIRDVVDALSTADAKPRARVPT